MSDILCYFDNILHLFSSHKQNILNYLDEQSPKIQFPLSFRQIPHFLYIRSNLISKMKDIIKFINCDIGIFYISIVIIDQCFSEPSLKCFFIESNLQLLSVLIFYLAYSINNLYREEWNEEIFTVHEKLLILFMQVDLKQNNCINDLLNFNFKTTTVYHYLQIFFYDFIDKNQNLFETEDMCEYFLSYYNFILFLFNHFIIEYPLLFYKKKPLFCCIGFMILAFNLICSLDEDNQNTFSEVILEWIDFLIQKAEADTQELKAFVKDLTKHYNKDSHLFNVNESIS